MLTACILASSLLFSSCIGSFALSGKVLSWNRSVGGKFVNELVFLACCIVPVYEITVLIDGVILNSVEFWTGKSAGIAYTKTVETEQGSVLVACDGRGYDITNQTTGQSLRFDFDEAEQTWALQVEGESYPLMSVVDDSHVKMINPDGSFSVIELSEQGVLAYSEVANHAMQYAMK